MDTVESVRSSKKISGSLAGTTDAAHLGNLMGIDSHLIERFHDLAGHGIVTAPGAECRGSSPILGEGQTQTINLLGFGGTCRHNYPLS